MAETPTLLHPELAPSLVCGYPIGHVDGAWWAFRPGSKAWRRRTRTYWRPIAGPCDTREEAERCARRFALRPAAAPKEHHE
jgi:hypothetical protein